MKHFISGTAIALTLALVLALGIAALAEGEQAQTPELPPMEDMQPAPEAQAPEAPATDAQAAQDTALQDALKALQEARQTERQESLEAELKGYVESGKLTQEQADLILDHYKEQQSLRNGTCPGCGYQFQDRQGKGGRMNGRGGMNGMNGKGGRGMMGRQGMNGMQNNGMAMTPDAQGMPQTNALDNGI